MQYPVTIPCNLRVYPYRQAELAQWVRQRTDGQKVDGWRPGNSLCLKLCNKIKIDTVTMVYFQVAEFSQEYGYREDKM